MPGCSQPKDAFVATANAFRARGGRGLNVTLPFKGEAFRYATQLSERARAAQAVNTLKFAGDVIFADNTDGAGFGERPGAKSGLCHRRTGAFCCSAQAGRRAA